MSTLVRHARRRPLFGLQGSEAPFLGTESILDAIHHTMGDVKWQKLGAIEISTTDLDLAPTACYTAFASAWDINHDFS